MSTTETNIIPAASGFYVLTFHTHGGVAAWDSGTKKSAIVGWNVPKEAQRGVEIVDVAPVLTDDPYIPRYMEDGGYAHCHIAMMYPDGSIWDDDGHNFYPSIEAWEAACIKEVQP